MIKIEITDSSVLESFNRLIAFGENPQGALRGIGEAGVQFTKERFQLSSDPYGAPWAQNTDATLRAVLHRKENISGKIFSKRKGKSEGTLNKSGLDYLSSKKPLIGESKDLSTEFAYQVDENGVMIFPTSVTEKKAAMMNFGGTKAEFPNLWGDIPARPFFPNEVEGLPDELSQEILNVLRAALENALKG